jgi:hypothetical protein
MARGHDVAGLVELAILVDAVFQVEIVGGELGDQILAKPAFDRLAEQRVLAGAIFFIGWRQRERARTKDCRGGKKAV